MEELKGDEYALCKALQIHNTALEIHNTLGVIPLSYASPMVMVT